MTKNLFSLLPPAPALRLRRPTWPILGGALLFSPLGRQVSSHPAPRGAWCAPRGVVGPRPGNSGHEATLPKSRAPSSFFVPILEQSPPPPPIKNKNHQAHSHLRSLDNPMLSHTTPVKTTRRPPSKTHTQRVFSPPS